MDFSKKQWEEKAAKNYGRLGNLAQWLRNKTKPAGIVAYSALATFTIWPLAQAASAAAAAGQSLPMPLLMTLGALVGNLGSNVLAGQIQSWYQSAVAGQPPKETDIINWLSQNVPQKADLKEELDTLLEELHTLEHVQTSVTADDWQTLAQQLQSEMQKLGNLPRFQAQLESGVIVQGEQNRVAVDHSAIVEGDVNGDVVLGSKTVQQITDPTQMEPTSLREVYLTRLLDQQNRLLLSGIDPKAATADNERLALSAVYTALLTESSAQLDMEQSVRAAQQQRQTRRLSAVEQLNRHPQLVLLGDPGSGKSTFVNFVAVCLAGEAMRHPQLNVALLTHPLPQDEEARRQKDEEKEPEPQPWDHGSLLPVCIVLRDFAATGLPQANEQATVHHLWHFITAQMEKASLAEFVPLLKKELVEKGGIFLFDGLDEVPTAEQHRIHIKQVVEDVARSYPKCRILVTSRTYAYQKQDWRLPTFQETVLAPFSRGQIEQFIDNWYRYMRVVRNIKDEDAQGRAALLKQAVFSSQRLYDLAERPLLLTLMASLHAWRGGSLPENREELYADAVDLLLDVWEQQRIVRKPDGTIQQIAPSLEQWLKVDRHKVRGLLNRLAYEAHSNQPAEQTETADVAEQDLVMGLLGLSAEKDLQPKRLMEFLSNRAGLLLPRGVAVYTFPHRTFQEYLTACHLTAVGYPGKVAQLARQDPNRWREVALLAGAKAARGTDYALWGLVEELCHCPTSETGTLEDYWGAHLAGQFLLESGELTELTDAQKRQVKRLKGWLVRVLTEPELPATERALAGRHLAQLGDPRPEVTELDKMQFCYVPPGDFYMGEGEDEHLQSCLNYVYWLGRYPVTHAQYMAFVHEDGYADERWWAEAIAAGVWEDGAYTGYGDRRTKPYDYGRNFQFANLPVVGVSWYEALAFCKWVTRRWHEQNILPSDWQVILPSEAEWEKAARGGVEIPNQPLPPTPITAVATTDLTQLSLYNNPLPKRIFPWGDDPLTTELANYDESEINQTSSVGCFPMAAASSVYGCAEMSGNVFEWTRSLDKPYPYDPQDGREKLNRGQKRLDQDCVEVLGHANPINMAALRGPRRQRPRSIDDSR